MNCTEIVLPKHLIHQRPDPMDVLIANLHENGAGVGQQVTGHGEAVAQVGQIGVDAVAPGVTEGLYLLRLSGDVFAVLPSFTSRLVVDHWKLELNLMP